MFLDIKTRLLAWCITTVRTLHQSDIRPRFVVCTGTSGKTLNRYAIATLLKHTNVPCVSPPQGYTNELGVLLAAVGLETASLWSWRTWRSLLFQPYVEDWVCIELGADFRADIPWFLKYFSPTVVVCTAEDARDWYPHSARTRIERRTLFASVPDTGFCILSESVQQTVIRPDYALHTVPVRPFIQLDSTVTFGPRLTALDVARVFGSHCQEILSPPLTIDAVAWPAHRLTVTTLRTGALLIADTYKSVPLCTNRFVRAAAQVGAAQRILVLGEPYPTLADPQMFAQELATHTKDYTYVILVCTRAFKDAVAPILHTHAWYGPHIEASTVAQALLTQAHEGDVIVLKGAKEHGFAKLEDVLCTT